MLVVPRPREGGLWWGEILGSALLQPGRSVCVSSERFFITYVDVALCNDIRLYSPIMVENDNKQKKEKKTRKRHKLYFTEYNISATIFNLKFSTA